MTLYARIAGSHLGSSTLFGGAFFATALASDGFFEALAAGSLASASWFGLAPILKRVAGGQA